MALENFLTIDAIGNGDVNLFQEEFYKTNTPVIIKGLWDSFPARNKWTADFFKKGLENKKVGVIDTNKAITRSSMKFGDYMDLLSSNEPLGLLLNRFNIFKYRRDLRNDFSTPSVVAKYLKCIAFMLFGCKNAVSKLRQNLQFSSIFHTQLHGTKQVWLFHPQYSNLLYKYPMCSESAVNIERPNYYTFPGLRYVEGMRCILEPGDTLYIPYGYWHYLKYVDGGYAMNQQTFPHSIGVTAQNFLKESFLPVCDKGFQALLGAKWNNYKLAKCRAKGNKEFYDISYEKKFRNLLPSEVKEAAMIRYH